MYGAQRKGVAWIPIHLIDIVNCCLHCQDSENNAVLHAFSDDDLSRGNSRASRFSWQNVPPPPSNHSLPTHPWPQHSLNLSSYPLYTPTINLRQHKHYPMHFNNTHNTKSSLYILLLGFQTWHCSVLGNWKGGFMLSSLWTSVISHLSGSHPFHLRSQGNYRPSCIAFKS